MQPETGSDPPGCAVLLAVLLVTSTFLLVFADEWTAAAFVGIAAALLIAGLIDPG